MEGEVCWKASGRREVEAAYGRDAVDGVKEGWMEEPRGETVEDGGPGLAEEEEEEAWGVEVMEVVGGVGWLPPGVEASSGLIVTILEI